MSREATDAFYARQEQWRVERAHAVRKAFVPYNLRVTTEPHVRKNHTVQVKVPEVGCLVGYNNSGYGDCSTAAYIVEQVLRERKGAPKHLIVRKIHGIDIGVGDADAMPERPGEAAIDPDSNAIKLTLQWNMCREEADSCALWRERRTEGGGHWTNASWYPGQYTSSCAGIDK
jgi:hypothetical protein